MSHETQMASGGRRPARERRVSSVLTGAALFLGAVGCSSPGRFPPAPPRPLVWPPPPERPRVALVAELRTPQDLGIGRGLAQRLMSFVAGGSDDQLIHPYGIAASARGLESGGPARLAVTDTDAHGVHLFDLERGEYRLIVEAGEDQRLVSPIGVAFDSVDRIYVTDSVRRELLRYRADGGFDRVLARSFARPTGVAIDLGRGVVYVADAVEHVVFRFDREGRALASIPLELHSPTLLAVTPSGQLIISDSLNFRVAVVSLEGKLVRTIGRAGDASGDLVRPKGVAADSEGHIYVADAIFDNVQIFDARGRLLLAFGSAGGGPGEFALPAGLAIDRRDLIYVADGLNGRVQVFRYLAEGRATTSPTTEKRR